MCSVFRRRIANEVISRLKPFLDGNEKPFFYNSLPLSIKLNQQKNFSPSFEISWNDIVKLKPDLKNKVHLTSLMTYLKNQDFPTVDGIVDINLENEKNEKLVFTVEQDLFTSVDFGISDSQLKRAVQLVEDMHTAGPSTKSDGASNNSVLSGPSGSGAFAPKSTLPVLAKTGESSKVFTCSACNKTFAAKFNLDRHVMTHTKSAESVMLDISQSINVIPQRSTFFKGIPPEIIVIDYSSPNIAKPFHYGHFRSTIMGNYLANLFQYVGHDVTRINYIGDWGVQYGILALGFKQFGSEEKLSQDALGHLFEIYRDSNARNEEDPEFSDKAKNYFKSMEEGNEEALELWKKLRDISLVKMEETYRRLNVKFDEVHSESMYAEKVNEVFDLLLQKGLAHCEDDGSIQTQIINPQGKEETVVLRKSDGTSLYLSRDLAAAIDRYKKYHFDHSYYIVDSSQSKHFNNLKSILKAMEFPWESNIHHVPFGRVLNFSTRKGTVVFLHDILNEAKQRTLEKMHESPNTKVTENFDEIADILGISSLIINDFSCKRKKDTPFSWDRVLSMTEDSGTSLQYCHARLCSIKEKCGLEVNTKWDLTSLVEPEAISLISHLAKFDEILYDSYSSLEPCVLVHYLFTLRSELGRAIKALNVKGSSPNKAQARLLLFHCAELILKKSLKLLGIKPLSKM